MSKEQAREDLAQELVQPSSDRGEATIWAAYQAWCAVNGMTEMPTPDAAIDAEQVLLRYLHSNRQARDWSWSTTRNYALVVAQRQVTAGHDDPRGPRVQAYIKAVRRQTGTRKGQPTDAFTADEVKAAPEVMEAMHPVHPHVVRRRALMAVSDVLEEAGVATLNPFAAVDVTQLWAVPASAFEVRGTEIRLTFDGELAIVARERTPAHYEVIVAGLAAPLDPEFPLRMTPEERPRSEKAEPNIDALLMRRSAGRAEPSLKRRRGKQPGKGTPAWHVENADARAYWRDATPEQRLWVMAHADPKLARRTRDLAYFLTGVVNAHRHAELARLTVGHVGKRDDGSYAYQLAEHKGSELARHRAGRGKPIIGELDHLATESGQCSLLCPACAMARHLRQRRSDGAKDAEPLFTAQAASPAGGQVLGREGAQKVVQRLFDLVDSGTDGEGTERRVGTRSMRVTAVTLMRKAGASYEEIGELTDHSSVDLVELYVRRADPWGSDLVLPLTG
jgi:hypothetical protein